MAAPSTPRTCQFLLDTATVAVSGIRLGVGLDGLCGRRGARYRDGIGLWAVRRDPSLTLRELHSYGTRFGTRLG